MKYWMICICLIGWLGGSVLRAENGPAISPAAMPAGKSPIARVEAKEADTNRADEINKEIQSLLQEETSLRGESRNLSEQLQNFAVKMGTNDTALTKLQQEWRDAQNKADGLRAELQAQIEKSPQFKELKTRSDLANEHLIQIRTRLRELMKDRGLIQGRARGDGRPGIDPMKSRESHDKALPPAKTE
jgi:chromosome segregation ATPase